MNHYAVISFDRVSIASSIVTIVHSLDFKDLKSAEQYSTGKSKLVSIVTEKVADQMSGCSTDSDLGTTREYFGQSPPQYSEVSAEDGYTYIDADASPNSSAPLQPLVLACSPSLTSGYIPEKESVLFDSHMSSIGTAQCDDGNHDENTSNTSNLCINKLRQEYVQANFSVSDSGYILRAVHELQDFDENRNDDSLPDYPCDSSSLVSVDETNPFSQESFSATENCLRMTSPVEDNEQHTIRLEENTSPRLTSSEYGNTQFQSITRQDTPLLQIPKQERHNSLSERGQCVTSSNFYQHQNQTDSSMDICVDPSFEEDDELHSNISKQLVRLNIHHDSVSSIDSGYIRTCDFD